MSLRLRLTLLGAALVAAMLLGFGWLLYALVGSSQPATQDQGLKLRAADAVQSIAHAPASELNGSIDPSLTAAEDLAQHTDPFVEVFGNAGRLLSTTGRLGNHAPALPESVLQAAINGTDHFATVNSASAPDLRVYATRWSRPDLGLQGVVVAGQPLSVQTTNRKGLLGFLIISSIPTLLAALVASWLITGRALKPLKTVAETADSIARTRDLGRRLPEQGRRDEIRLLSESFNGMLEQLRQSQAQLASALEAQRRFVADASHELRTPLTTIRGNAELLAQGPAIEAESVRAAARDIASESERMSRMVEQMLRLAQADAGQRLDLTPMPLRPLIESVCRQAQISHADRQFRTTGLTDATVNADDDAMRQLLWILVDNATKFTPPGGCIELGLQRHDRSALVTVADDGAGIPQADLDRIFERFYQADASRSNHGAGLGLAIARWIVEQHQGTVTARNNDGRGATFTVSLPLAA